MDEKIREAVERKNNLLSGLIEVAQEGMDRLTRLEQEDRHTIVALLIATNLVSQLSHTKTSKSRLLEVWRRAGTLSPQLGGAVPDIMMGCMSEMIAYAKAVAGCDEDEDELECESHAGSEAAAVTLCLMEQLANLPKLFDLDFPPDFPPPPTPPPPYESGPLE